jgi:hypothetical protein
MPPACPRCGKAVTSSARRCPHCDAVLPRGATRVELSTPRPAELPAPQAPAPAPPPGRPAAEVLVEGARAGVRGGTRLFRRLPRRAKLILAGVVAALVIGVPVTLWVVGKVAYAPEEPVEDLVAAFNDGDIGLAGRLSGCSSPLCREETLDEGYEAPTDMSVTAVAMGGDSSPDTADVTVRYELAGQRRQSIVRVRRDSGVLPQEWAIASGVTGSLEVVTPAPVRTVRVADVDVPVGTGGRTSRERALLGAYTVTVASDNPLYEAAPQTVALAGDLRNRSTVTSVEVTPTIRAAARDEVDRQVRALLEQCADLATDRPNVSGKDCPFAHTDPPMPSGSTGQTWTIVDPPVVDLVKPDRPQRDAELEVRTTKPGKVTFNFTFDGTEFGPYETGIKVSGVVRLDNGAVRFIPAG